MEQARRSRDDCASDIVGITNESQVMLKAKFAKNPKSLGDRGHEVDDMPGPGRLSRNPHNGLRLTSKAPAREMLAGAVLRLLPEMIEFMLYYTAMRACSGQIPLLSRALRNLRKITF